MILFLAISFCGFCYQALFAKGVYLHLQQDLIAYAFVNAVIFFGIAVGCYSCANKLRDSKSNLKSLVVTNELELVIFSLLSMAYLNVVNPAYPLAITAFIGMFLFFLVGYTQGRELVLVYHFFQNSFSNRVGIAIGFTYFGSLIASVVCTFYFFTQLNPNQFILLPAIISLAIALFVMVKLKQNFFQRDNRQIFIRASVAIILVIFLSLYGNVIFKYGKLKTYDLSTKNSSFAELEKNLKIESSASKYQIADWVTYNG
ncbi:MAG: hypothetical protein V4736_10290, partial [Bdellovibrionota bacterium]